MFPMDSFHGDFPSVTPLETARRIINLGETCARTVLPKLRAMPLLVPASPSQPVHGDKRRLVAIGLAAALVLAAVAAWSAVRPDSYSQSGPGCVTITIPSSMGGAMLHECGTRARLMCRNALGHHDRLSRLIRPQCRTAGLR